jgi:carbamoyl-phosphate synthase large subunit
MNVLLTSVGRRSYLVQYFKEALGPRGLVICANSRNSAPARQSADVFYQVPESSSDDYLPEIRRICQAHRVRALFSFHDLDTFVLSRNHAELSALGLTAFLPSPSWNDIALDKLLTFETLTRHGLPCPWTTDCLEDAQRRMEAAEAGGGSLPLVIKARFGFGSLGLRFCRDAKEIGPAYQAALAEVERAPFATTIARLKPGQTRLVLQEQIAGREICLDVVNDLEGRHLTTLATEIHSMRAGESDTASTVPVDATLAALFWRLSRLTRHIGIWGLDCVVRQGTPFVLDLNPRFTGAYPFSHLAGANIPRALLALVAGAPVAPGDLVCRSPVQGYKDLVPRLGAAAGAQLPAVGDRVLQAEAGEGAVSDPAGPSRQRRRCAPP